MILPLFWVLCCCMAISLAISPKALAFSWFERYVR
jgi:hypothetical protein